MKQEYKDGRFYDIYKIGEDIKKVDDRTFVEDLEIYIERPSLKELERLSKIN